MPKENLSPEALALIYLRSERGWRQKDLASRLGLSDYRQISRYESGERPLSRETLDSIAAALGHPREAVDALVSLHPLISDGPRQDAWSRLLAPEERRKIARAALTTGWTAAETLYSQLAASEVKKKAEAARQEAGELWARLKAYPSPKRRELAAASPEPLRWALVERVCEASVRAAADDPRRALELADLALSIAEQVEGEEGWRRRLKGYAWAHAANARRVANDFAGADEAFVRAWNLWHAGAASDPGLLPEWRLLSLEASLRREQHRFPEALALLDRAARAAGGDPGAAGRIFLQKEHVLEQTGDVQGALTALIEAAPFIEASGDLHLIFALHFNTADNLCQLNRYGEAEALLPQVRELAMRLGNELDLVRTVWLSARIAAGQGRREEAIAGLEQVRREFTVRQLPYDAARASLELAALWLEEGRTAEVRELSVAMVWIFKAQGIARETLAALAIFRDAAQKETATVELVRHVLAEMEKVRRSAPRPEAGRRGRG
ncbi:MAG TPA: helix-turn-helix transcriptional regulator [Thermoanaerobaculia bacterium]|jgi:transcriptional regulator with XRE-family HTH domain|nr:helix-turn-helix transcriptional regulator [Thermoanaerobaculia bacterium]